MSNRRTFIQKILGATTLLAASGWVGAFVHPLDEPVMPTVLGTRTPLMAVVRTGQRLVAVGYRGVVIFSDDMGKTWRQAKVPVSSDLVAVNFPTEKLGWAVGHGGVVLNTTDAGASWTKQLDGRQAGKLAIEYLDKKAADGHDAALSQIAADERSVAEMGGTQPFLDVYFENEKTGYVVGTFNRLFRTDDGGVTWMPWMDRTDNPLGLHFNAIAGDGKNVFLAGEQGAIWRLESGSKRFVGLKTSYKGTLFGVAPLGPSILLAHGMRGSVFRSTDNGSNWEQVAVSGKAGITKAAVLSDGVLVLVTQAGTLEISRDNGKSFSSFKPAQPMPYFGVVGGEKNQLVLVGAEGVRIEQVR